MHTPDENGTRGSAEDARDRTYSTQHTTTDGGMTDSGTTGGGTGRGTDRDTARMPVRNAAGTEAAPGHGSSPYAPDASPTTTGTSGYGDDRYATGGFGGTGTDTAPTGGYGTARYGDGRFDGSAYDDTYDATRDGGQFAAGDLGDGLIPASEAARLRAELQHAVGAFVDSPEQSVAEADSVLQAAVERITASLTERRKAMRTNWDGAEGADGSDGTSGNGSKGSHGRDLDTEKWRVIMLDYRDTMERLLSA